MPAGTFLFGDFEAFLASQSGKAVLRPLASTVTSARISSTLSSRVYGETVDDERMAVAMRENPRTPASVTKRTFGNCAA